MYRVLHVDLDQFIAAVEMLRRPELAGRPVVVGGHGDPTRRGVVATANYAAREHGIRSGMPLRTAARRCPDAVFLPADNAAYEAASDEVMAVLRSFGPTDGAVVEVLGWDEAFVGVTTDDAVDIAQRIRDEVHTRTRLTCCVGIGDNLLRAKIATDVRQAARPQRGRAPGRHRRVHADRDRTGTRSWATGRPGRCGGSARRRQRSSPSGACTRSASWPPPIPTALAADLGPALGPWYVQLGQGVGRVEVRGEPWVARSRGHEETFATDLTDWAEVRSAAAGLARRVAADVTAEGRPAARVGVTVRFAPFTTRTRSATLPDPTSDGAAIEAAALAVLDRFTPRATGPAGGRPRGVHRRDRWVSRHFVSGKPLVLT